MNSNYYMLEQLTTSITTGRKQDAKAYRLWKRATESLRSSEKPAGSGTARNGR